MKVLLIGLVALVSFSSFASDDYQINCKKGFAAFEDRVDRILLNKSEIIPVPPLKVRQSTRIKLFESSTHEVEIVRYESQLVISLNKKITKYDSDIVGFAGYRLIDGNTINLSIKDSAQRLDFLDCKIEEVKS